MSASPHHQQVVPLTRDNLRKLRNLTQAHATSVGVMGRVLLTWALDNAPADVIADAIDEEHRAAAERRRDNARAAVQARWNAEKKEK